MKPNYHTKFKQRVREYYEQNTPWFQLFGTSNRSHAIHRPVWADGITDRRSALNYVDDQILKQTLAYKQDKRLDHICVIDLGCGVGGSLHLLAGELGDSISAIGITLSTKQARLAQMRSNQLGTQAGCTYLAADFQSMPFRLEIDIAFSIESFAHAIEPEMYFAEAARVLKPGGRLILCDDFQSSDSSRRGAIPEDQRWLQLFKSGWYVPHLLSPRQVAAIAHKHRLKKIEEKDLTRFLRKRTLPKQFIPFFRFAITRLNTRHPFFGSIFGGMALEHCIGRGLVTYRFLIFEKQGGTELSTPS